MAQSRYGSAGELLAWRPIVCDTRAIKGVSRGVTPGLWQGSAVTFLFRGYSLECICVCSGAPVILTLVDTREGVVSAVHRGPRGAGGSGWDARKKKVGVPADSR